MTSVQIVLCVIAALVSTVYGQQCTKCLGRNQEHCDVTETVDCATASCVVVSEKCNAEGLIFPSVGKNCASNPALCDQFLIFNNLDDELAVRLHMQCCTGDKCNDNIKYTIPQDDGELNGKYCESCFRNDIKGECFSEKRVQCRGNQNKCLSYAGTVERADGKVVDYSAKGCVSDLGCLVKLGALIGTKEMEERVFECTDPTSG